MTSVQGFVVRTFFGFANVSGRIGTLFNFSAFSAILSVRTFFGFANVSGRIGTLFNFSAVQFSVCEPFLGLRTFLGGYVLL